MNPIYFFLITVGLPVVCGTVIVITLIFVGAFKKRDVANVGEEDAKILQEMHQSLVRMEKRIDSLETIYFEMDRKGDKK